MDINNFSEKYEGLVQLTKNMKLLRYRDRPSCEFILKNKNSWALEKQNLENKDLKLLKVMANSDLLEKSFVDYFIKSKSKINQINNHH
jgi:predicted phosphohydrolase